MNTSKKWTIYIIATLFFLYEAVQMAYFNSIGSYLSTYFSLDYVQISFLASIYYYAAAIALIPAGLLLDRLNTKNILLTAMSISVISSIMFSQSNSFGACLFWRALSGFSGGAFSFIGTIRIASTLFEGKKLSFAVGVLITVGMLGGIIAQMPMTLLIEHFTWQTSTLIYASCGILIILLNFYSLKKITQAQISIEHYKKNILNLFLSVIKNKQTWIAAFYVCFMDTAINLFGTLWGQQYLMNSKGFSQNYASLITSILFFGTILGSPIIGWCSDHFNFKKSAMILGAFISVITGVLVIIIDVKAFYIIAMLYLFLGFLAGFQSLGYSSIIENNPLATSSASSIASFLVIGFGAVLRQLYAVILTIFQNSDIQKAYMFAGYILVIAFVISFLLSFFIKKKGECHA